MRKNNPFPLQVCYVRNSDVEKTRHFIMFHHVISTWPTNINATSVPWRVLAGKCPTYFIVLYPEVALTALSCSDQNDHRTSWFRCFYFCFQVPLTNPSIVLHLEIPRLFCDRSLVVLIKTYSVTLITWQQNDHKIRNAWGVAILMLYVLRS